MIRTAVCRPGYSSGTSYEQLGTLTNVNAQGDLQIASVRKVTAKQDVELVGGSLNKGTYIVQLEAPGSCYDSGVNVKKSLHFDQSNLSLESITLAKGSRVGDDLIRAAVCRHQATDYATYLLTVPADKVELKLEGGFSIKKIEEVTESETVSLR